MRTLFRLQFVVGIVRHYLALRSNGQGGQESLRVTAGYRHANNLGGGGRRASVWRELTLGFRGSTTILLHSFRHQTDFSAFVEVVEFGLQADHLRGRILVRRTESFIFGAQGRQVLNLLGKPGCPFLQVMIRLMLPGDAADPGDSQSGGHTPQMTEDPTREKVPRGRFAAKRTTP